MSHHSVESMKDVAFRKGRNAFKNDEEYLRALHGEELLPQLMAYGVQTGKNQISRAIQANQSRPIEGASLRGSAGASVRIDNESMTDERYEEIKRRTLRDGPQTL